MTEPHPVPTAEEIRSTLVDRRNWGRWGDDDEVGAINLITPEKRLQAMSLVRSGRSVSLCRPFPKQPGPQNPQPAQHYLQRIDFRTGGEVVDYYGIHYHGYSATHLDALCHVWDADGMWNGRQPDEVITSQGVRFGAVTNWATGIVTRGVLLDVPRFRGEPYVTVDRPVHGWELEAIAEERGVEIGPGDALVVHSGRAAFQEAHPDKYLGRSPSPGLHASCAKFVRDHDVSVLVWDVMDAMPNEYRLPWPVHGVIFSFGVALVDNALLEPLAAACIEEGRDEFLLMVLPLVVEGGTGSPVNPVAMF